MSAKLAKLIKDARTNAGLTQQQLADMVPGLTVADISKAEHNEKEPTQEELKGIAKATGVTQKSLLEASSAKPKTASAKNGTAKAGTSKSTTTKSTTTKSSTEKTTAKSTTTKSTTTKSTAATTSVKLTAEEKRLVELYRKADKDTKKAALKVLKGEDGDGNDLLTSIIEGAVGAFLK